MNIDLLAISFNEERTIRQFLNHYSFCKYITIYDNLSTDKTVEIIQNTRPDAKVIQFNTNNIINNAKFLEIKNEAWKENKDKVDWQIVVDCDEYIWNPFEDSVVDYLKMIREMHESVSLIPTIGYNLHFDFFHDDFLNNLNDASFSPIYGKYCIFNPKKITDINYKIGAHECHPKGLIDLTCPHLFLLHLKYIGFEYWKERNTEYSKRVNHTFTGASMYTAFDSIESEAHYKREFEQNRMDLKKLFKLKGYRKK